MDQHGSLIRTDRLVLIPCQAEVARAAVRQGPRAVSALLGVDVDPSWPPADLREILPGHADVVEAAPQLAPWGVWLVLDGRAQTLVGDAGFKGPPGPDGEIEIGYGVVDRFRRKGYATEVVGALAAWAFAQGGVTHLLARCFSDNIPSQGVLRKAGFEYVREEEGVQEWVLKASR